MSMPLARERGTSKAALPSNAKERPVVVTAKNVGGAYERERRISPVLRIADRFPKLGDLLLRPALPQLPILHGRSEDRRRGPAPGPPGFVNLGPAAADHSRSAVPLHIEKARPSRPDRASSSPPLKLRFGRPASDQGKTAPADPRA